MSQNPYSPPAAKQAREHGGRSLGCTIMFWLSCVLCVITLGIAINGSYQYLFYTQQGIPLPAHILGETACVACSGLGMLYAANMWRQQRMRRGAAAFCCALVTFLVGPLLI